MDKYEGDMRTKNLTRFDNEYMGDYDYQNRYRHLNIDKYTAVLEFEVISPQHELEKIGERLKLSLFGEYCPDNSLRGYSLEELLIKPQHYRAKVIVQMGKIIMLNHK